MDPFVYRDLHDMKDEYTEGGDLIDNPLVWVGGAFGLAAVALGMCWLGDWTIREVQNVDTIPLLVVFSALTLITFVVCLTIKSCYMAKIKARERTDELKLLQKQK